MSRCDDTSSMKIKGHSETIADIDVKWETGNWRINQRIRDCTRMAHDRVRSEWKTKGEEIIGEGLPITCITIYVLQS